MCIIPADAHYGRGAEVTLLDVAAGIVFRTERESVRINKKFAFDFHKVSS